MVLADTFVAMVALICAAVAVKSAMTNSWNSYAAFVRNPVVDHVHHRWTTGTNNYEQQTLLRVGEYFGRTIQPPSRSQYDLVQSPLIARSVVICVVVACLQCLLSTADTWKNRLLFHINHSCVVLSDVMPITRSTERAVGKWLGSRPLSPPAFLTNVTPTDDRLYLDIFRRHWTASPNIISCCLVGQTQRPQVRKAVYNSPGTILLRSRCFFQREQVELKRGEFDDLLTRAINCNLRRGGKPEECLQSCSCRSRYWVSGVSETSVECSGLQTTVLSAKLGCGEPSRSRPAEYKKDVGPPIRSYDIELRTTSEKRSTRREKWLTGGNSATASIRAVKSRGKTGDPRENLSTSEYPGVAQLVISPGSPPAKANRVQSPAGSPDFRCWESCQTMPLVGGFSRGSLVSRPLTPVPLHIHLITLIGSQDHAVKSRPNFLTPHIGFSEEDPAHTWCDSHSKYVVAVLAEVLLNLVPDFLDG
ncbi:hypothetical protein PR048_016262 [Dryococelus australis]|uniref:Uncharacterized protein n=1 Tax=Dryococelus australis TaxID=614101 RepID=A0ABQ9HJE5_9NEOP|nr:hypothetical protein PR048_016262 [Dryococelus australis]